jgi:hypothetical protein
MLVLLVEIAVQQQLVPPLQIQVLLLAPIKIAPCHAIHWRCLNSVSLLLEILWLLLLLLWGLVEAGVLGGKRFRDSALEVLRAW